MNETIIPEEYQEEKDAKDEKQRMTKRWCSFVLLLLVLNASH